MVSGAIIAGIGGASFSEVIQNEYLAPPEEAIEYRLAEQESSYFGIDLGSANNEANSLTVIAIGGMFMYAGWPARRRKESGDDEGGNRKKPKSPRTRLRI